MEGEILGLHLQGSKVQMLSANVCVCFGGSSPQTQELWFDVMGADVFVHSLGVHFLRAGSLLASIAKAKPPSTSNQLCGACLLCFLLLWQPLACGAVAQSWV